MELEELKTLWTSNNAKLEKSINLSEQNIALIQTQKVASTLAPLYRQRVVECIFHSLAIVLLISFLIKNRYQFPYAASAIVLLAFYSFLPFLHAIKQINMIRTMDYNKDLATLQTHLIKLQTHSLIYTRLAVLFVPTFLAYPVIVTKLIRDFHIKALSGFDIIAQSNGNWWSVQLIGFIVLIPLGIWFYLEVSYKNLGKKWVKDCIGQSLGKE